MEVVDSISNIRKPKFEIKRKELTEKNVVITPEKSSINNWNYIKKECDNVISDIPVQVGKEFTPNEYQKPIFEFIKRQVDTMNLGGFPENMVCEAGAGCTKTTTMVQSTKFIPSRYNIGFVAFNKDVVEVLKPKVSSNTRVQTFHGAGFGAIRYRFKNVRVNDKKMYMIYQNMYNDFKFIDKRIYDEARESFIRICGFIKNTYTDFDYNENIRGLIEEYDIDIGDCDEEVLFKLVRHGMRLSNQDVMTIDFNDMIYIPILLKLSFFKVNVLFVDETQDLNKSQLLMLGMMIHNKGFIFCVGDRHQAIYGFRGADADAMVKMISELKVKNPLPLYKTYRCGKNIVKLANELVPELISDESNCEGEVRDNISWDEFYKLVKVGDMVLCRNTAPLIKPVFRLLANGIKVSIKGRDISEGLINIIKKIKTKWVVNDISNFYKALEEWLKDELIKAQRKKNESLIQTIEDKYECLMAISDECETVDDIIKKIEILFAEGKSEIIFSTIHRAKGLESDKVFILNPQLIPSKYAKNEKKIQEERNILYVGITRAKSGLYSVGGNINTKF